MAVSDIKAKRLTGAASLAVGPARIRQIQVLTSADGVGRLTITDGSGGETLIDIDFAVSDSHSVNVPDNGIRAQEDVLVTTATNITAVTIFYS